MRFIFANNYYYIRGGCERSFFSEMGLLASRGHGIAPFSRHFEKNLPSANSHFFPSQIKYENAPFFQKAYSGIEMIYSLQCRKKFTALLDSFKPDIIHAHNIYGRLTTSIIDAAKKKRIPVLMTLHDYKLICPGYSMICRGRICEACKDKKFLFCLLKKCHKDAFIPSLVYTTESYFNVLFKKYEWIKYFICPSRFSMKKHAECGMPLNKLVYIPNFINPSVFEPNFKFGKYILYAGRLSKEKGVLTLLEAVKDADVVLKIAGDGPLKTEYEAYIKENKIYNVIFEGYKSGDELMALFRNAMFLVLPSECYENAPMSVLEAFAYGKPVIGSNIGGMPELITDGETGLLFESGNCEDLRKKIDYLLNSPAKIVTMGENARKRIEEEYNSEKHYERLMDVYKLTLGN